MAEAEAVEQQPQEQQVKSFTFNVDYAGNKRPVTVTGADEQDAYNNLAWAIEEGRLDLGQFQAESAPREVREWSTADYDPNSKFQIDIMKNLDGGPRRLELFDGAFGMPLSPMASAMEFGRFAESAAMGARNFLADTAVFGIDALMAIESDPEMLKKQEETRRKVVEWRLKSTKEDTDAIVQAYFKEPNPLGEFVGNALPLFAAPYEVGGYMSTALYNTMLGGAAGGIGAAYGGNYEDIKSFEDRLGAVKIGAVMGVGGHVLLNTRRGMAAYASRRLDNMLQTDYGINAQQLEKFIQERVPEFSFDLAQVTGSPSIANLVRVSQGNVLLQAQNQRIRQINQYINTVIEGVRGRTPRYQLIKKDGRYVTVDRGLDRTEEGILADHGELTGPDYRRVVSEIDSLNRNQFSSEITLGLGRTFAEYDKSMYQAASSQYATNLEGLISTHGDDLVLDYAGLLDYRQTLDKVFMELGSPQNFGDPSLIPQNLIAHKRWLDQMMNPYVVEQAANGVFKVKLRDTGTVVNTFAGNQAKQQANARMMSLNRQNGHMNLEDTADLLRGFAKLFSGDVPLGGAMYNPSQVGSVMNVGRMLQGKFLSILQADSKSPATEQLLMFRNQYRQAQENITRNRMILMGHLIGDPQKAQNVDEVMNYLLNRDEAANKAFADLMNQINPGLLDDIKTLTLKRALNQGRDLGTPANMEPFNLRNAINAFGGVSEHFGVGQLGRGLFTEAEQAEIVAASSAMRHMLMTHQDWIERGTQGFLRDASINVLSRSVEFFGRFLVGAGLAGETAAQFLQNPATRKAIIQLANSKELQSQKSKAAIALLAYYGGAWKAEQDAEAKIKQQMELEKQNAELPQGP